MLRFEKVCKFWGDYNGRFNWKIICWKKRYGRQKKKEFSAKNNKKDGVMER